MTYDTLLAFLTFAFVGSITPGPNNLMLLTSGTNFGIRLTLPHMLGVTLGHSLMVALVGFGLIGLFEVFPLAHNILKILSVTYMVWLAWRVASSVRIDETPSKGRPLTFFEAALFQWVNPKAWAMALTAIAVYVPDRNLLMVLYISLLFCVVNFPSVASWAILGQQMRKFLTTQSRLRLFNFTMAGLLIASMYPVLFSAKF